MRIFRSLRKHNGMARVAVFLIAVALLMGTAACGGLDTYQLTISSTAGGSVSTPGEGAFTCDAGTVVELLATPDDSYGFQAWTGDIQDIADPDSRATTITMNGNYLITANFGPTGPPGPSVP
jgi:hypothetical protein